MKCPEKPKVVAYAEGRISNDYPSERLDKHIQSCPECQKWLDTHNALQSAGEEMTMRPEEIPEFEMTPFLRTAIMQKAEALRGHQPGKRWEVFLAWFRPFGKPAVAAGAVVSLLAVGVFVWLLIQTEQSDRSMELAGVTYQVWGEAVELSHMQEFISPPALRSSQVSKYLGFFTPTLIAVLGQPANTEVFWEKLSAAFADQEIRLETRPKALVIEDSMFDAIQSKQNVSDQQFWIFSDCDGVVLMHWAEGN